MAGKVLAICWLTFTVFVIVVYTAGMIVVLNSNSVSMRASPFQNVDDIAQQDLAKSKVYVVAHGSTYNFFRVSKIAIYEKIYAMLKPVANTKEGLDKVNEEENAVFFGESTTLQYHMKKKCCCDLVQVGGLLDSKGFGIALPIGHELVHRVSLAILELKENGIISQLQHKWFLMKNAGQCPVAKSSSGRSMLSQVGTVSGYQFSGAIILLILGLTISAVVLILEIMLNKGKNKV